MLVAIYVTEGESATSDFYDQGVASYSQQDYQGCVENFSKFLEQNPTTYKLQAYFNRAVCFVQLQEFQQAINDLDRALQIDPSNASVYFLKGTCLLYQESFEDALENFDHALELDNGNEKIYVNRGIARYHLRQQTKAIEDFNKAIQLDPSDALAYYHRGKSYVALAASSSNDPKVVAAAVSDPKACADFKKGCDLGDEPSCKEVRMWCRKMTAQPESEQRVSDRANTRYKRVMLLASLQIPLLQAYLQGDKPPAVIDTANFPGEAIEFTPSQEELKDALDAALLMQEGDQLTNDKQPAQAIQKYQAALLKNPEDPLLMMALGVAQFYNQEAKEALSTLQKAYEMAPDGYYQKERIKKNLDTLKQALAQ